MSKLLPTRLASEPLIEVVSEVRFAADADSAVNFLPGILHAKFGPFDQQGRAFPVALPPELLAADPTMSFRPHVILAKDNRVIQVGPRVVSVAFRAPYPGWTEFSSFIRRVFDVVAEQSFVKEFDWVSLKYVDIVSFEDEQPTLDWLNAEISLGGIRVDTQSSTIRIERVEGPVTTVIQVGSPAKAQVLGRPEINGVLVDVDTIHREPFSNFSSEYPVVLDQLHDRNKRQFFSLLTDETQSRLGPEY